MKQSKKARAFELFSQGYLPLSKEIKDLGLHPANRYKYFYEWEALGKPSGIEQRHSQPPMGNTKSPSGETIGGIDETKARPKNDQEEKPTEALRQAEQIQEGVENEGEGLEEDIEPEEVLEKPKAQDESIGGVDESRGKGEKKDEEGKEKKGKYEVTVASEGVRCVVFLSFQTLALYEIAAAKQAQLAKDGEAKLTLGDYLDNCSEQFFKDRKLKLGLVEI